MPKKKNPPVQVKLDETASGLVHAAISSLLGGLGSWANQVQVEAAKLNITLELNPTSEHPVTIGINAKEPTDDLHLRSPSPPDGAAAKPADRRRPKRVPARSR